MINKNGYEMNEVLAGYILLGGEENQENPQSE
jgi:hypothetical protein